MSERCKAHSAIEITDHLWVPMPDGVRLAARMWKPKDNTPAPAILEYIPYRKTDMVRARDERNHPYFAANGYACIRVDMRGSGDSEGHMPDMYSDHELSDARHVISWLAKQPWCNGRVGMFGTSWGGTASLQASIDAPDALKAVIAVCATHDRYEDDIHHMGGCLLTDTIEWGATLPTILGSPPTPNVGPDWQNIWRERFNTLPFPLETWLREQGRGTYWRHGSVKHDTSRLTIPILGIGGWADRYSNSVMALVEARPDLIWGVIGPWGHHYPDHGHPGPAIGFQDLALEWWDAWLKTDTPVAPDWPKLRVWMREFETPANAIDERAGRWVESPPTSEVTKDRVLHLTSDLVSNVPGDEPSRVPHDLSIGRMSGDTGYFGRFGGLPLDQNEDDARSLTFETEAFENDIAIYGEVLAHLIVRTNQPTGQIILRLNDIAPDGTASRITYAVRNLALNDQLDIPDQSPPDDALEVNIPLHTTAYRLRCGHKLRLSVSSSYWPLVWPTGVVTKIEILRGEIKLPLFNGRPTPLAKPLPEPLDLPLTKTHCVKSSQMLKRWSVEKEGKLIFGWHQPWSAVYYAETGTTFGYETQTSQVLSLDDPTSAEYSISHRMVYDRPDGKADLCCTTSVRCDHAFFHIDARLLALWGDDVHGEKCWKHSVPRQV